MTHGSNDAAERNEGAEPVDPSTSARFRIEIDAFGRVVPRVVPPETDTREAGKTSHGSGAGLTAGR